MKYLKEYNENNGLEDLEDCLQEIFDKYNIFNKKHSGYYYPNINMFPLNDIEKIKPTLYYYAGKSTSSYLPPIKKDKKGIITSKSIYHGILIGKKKKKLLPIKNEILQKKDMIQKRIGKEIVVNHPPNPDYLFIYPI